MTTVERLLEGGKKCYNAVSNKNIDLLKDIINEYGSECIDFYNQAGITTLANAIVYNQVEMVQLLLENKADINHQDNIFQNTPMHWAVVKNRIDIANNILIPAGANIHDLKNRDGLNVVSLAAKLGHAEGFNF